MDYTIVELRLLIKRHDRFEDYYLDQLIRVTAADVLRRAAKDKSLRLPGHSGISVRKMLAKADVIQGIEK